jgi:ankyrin repeat protein
MDDLNRRLRKVSRKGELGEARRLVDTEGADVNATGWWGETALYFACKHGHTDAVAFFLERNADVHAKDSTGKTALRVATENGHTEVVTLLLCTSDADVNTQNNDRWTPLHVACWEGTLEMVELLANSGADLNILNGEGRTPLHLASCYHRVEIAKVLLEKNEVNVNAGDTNGCTSLHLASEGTFYRTEKETNMIVLLLEKGANANAQSKDGCTPLHVATQNEQDDFEVARILLNYGGANQLIRNRQGDIPMHLACRRTAHHAMIDLLIQNQLASLCVDDKEGWLPLHLACINNASPDAVYALMRNDPNGSVSRYRREES